MQLVLSDGAGHSARELRFRLEGAHICDLRVVQGAFDVADVCLCLGKTVLDHCRP